MESKLNVLIELTGRELAFITSVLWVCCMYIQFPSPQCCRFLTDDISEAPKFLTIFVETGDRENEQIITIKWSEVFNNCNGPVSLYSLSVIPPTSDCKYGSGDCMYITDQTTYKITMAKNETLTKSIKVSGIACENIRGPEGVRGKT